MTTRANEDRLDGGRGTWPTQSVDVTASSVFVDDTGRRWRRARRIGQVLGVCFLAYLLLLGASLARAPWVPQVSLPRVGNLLAPEDPIIPSLGPAAVTTPLQDSPAGTGHGAAATDSGGDPGAVATAARVRSGSAAPRRTEPQTAIIAGATPAPMTTASVPTTEPTAQPVPDAPPASTTTVPTPGSTTETTSRKADRPAKATETEPQVNSTTTQTGPDERPVADPPGHDGADRPSSARAGRPGSG